MEQSVTKVRQLIMGFRNTQLLYVAAKLNIADRLNAAPKSANTLAQEAGAHPMPCFGRFVLSRAWAFWRIFRMTVSH